MLNTAPHSNKEKSKDKHGLKKQEERALFKNKISANTKGEKKHIQKRPDLGKGGGGRSVRTFLHVRHIPDPPRRIDHD